MIFVIGLHLCVCSGGVITLNVVYAYYCLSQTFVLNFILLLAGFQISSQWSSLFDAGKETGSGIQKGMHEGGRGGWEWMAPCMKKVGSGRLKGRRSRSYYEWGDEWSVVDTMEDNSMSLVGAKCV